MKNRHLLLGLFAGVVLGIVGWALMNDDAEASISSDSAVETPPARVLQGLTARSSVAELREALGPQAVEEKAPSTGSLRVRVWFGSGSTRRPAPGFPVVVKRYYGIDTMFGLIEAEADQTGEVLVPNIPPGPLLVYPGRMLPWWKRATVKAGQTVQVDLEFKDFISITGIVVDERRAPIAGATIEAVRIEAGTSPFPVGVSGADGRFKVVGIPEIGAVGARAPGFIAARLRSITEYGRGETKLDVEIVLARGGGSVSGVVLDAKDFPVKGAKVCIGKEREREMFHYIKLPDGAKGFIRAAIEARTNAAGEFHIFGLPPGPQMVRIRAANAAPWVGSCEVSADATANMVVNLGEGVSCEGIVLESDGSPAKSCIVWADTARSFFRSEALTDRDGAYRLTGIAPGSVTLQAEYHEKHRAKVDLLGAPGDTLSWSPRLGGGIELRGRVITMTGRPISNVSVQVAEDPGEKSGSLRIHFAETDAEGRFKVAHVEPGPILFITVLTGVHQPRMLSRVDASAGECIFKIPDPGRPTARIIGRVRGADGEVVHNGTAKIRVAGDTKFSTKPSPRTGRFEFKALLKGPYTLRVQAPGYITETRTRNLEEGEHWILDDILLFRSGWVVVPMTEVPRETRRRLSMRLRRDGASQQVFSLDCSQSPARSVPVRPGRYRLEVGGVGVAAASVIVEVRSGVPTEVAVPIRPGTRCAIRVHLPPGAGTEKDVKLTIESARGIVLERNMPRATGLIRPLVCSLLPGDYEVSAALSDGRAGATKVRVESPTAEPFPIEVRVER